MTPLHRLHPVWVNAALLGSVWASVEIVLGSFLHNLRLPMAGTVMAALGVSLLVAGSRMWNMPGLIWRAGAICALMKSVSPSAVILGPMVGIFLEALVLESATRILGRNAAGALVGGALATSLPIIQKIAGLLVLYGFDAARLTIALYEMAARALHIASVGPLHLVLFLFALTLTLGAIAAAIGLSAGRRAARMLVPAPLTAGGPVRSPFDAPPAEDHFRLPLLGAHAAAVPAGLFAVSSLPAGISAALIACYSTLTVLRYRRVRTRLLRVRLWVEFALVSVLAGLVLGELTSESPGWTWNGLTVGLQMTARATLIITAFSAISVELRNPVVLGWFLRRGLDSYAAALGVAFEALPAMMDAIGRQKSFFRSPLDSVARVLASARMWLAARHEQEAAPVILITGAQGSGKTTFAGRLADTLARQGMSPSGILSVVVREGGERVGYDVQNIASGGRLPLCRRTAAQSEIHAGQFAFAPAGITFGEKALYQAAAGERGVIFVDEVGPLELGGGGWGNVLDHLLPDRRHVALLVVRPQLVETVCGHWRIQPAAVWDAGSMNVAEAARFIIRMAAGESGGTRVTV